MTLSFQSPYPKPYNYIANSACSGYSCNRHSDNQVYRNAA